MYSMTTHIPVMQKEVLEFLNLKPGNCVVDCTLGTGGHSSEILRKIGPKGYVIGIDRDADSLAVAKERLKGFNGCCNFVQQDFRHIDTVLQELGVREVDAILFDLGISSFQLDNPERGFSIRLDGPLDMRMDKNSYISASDILNSLSEEEISSILRNFGQERWHNRIARFLVKQREKTPIESTSDLSSSVLRAIPGHQKRQRIHPATRTFQALRIAVNRELEALEIALDKCIDFLKKDGRICVISFHSLEDKIVKEKFRYFAKEKKLKILTKKPLQPKDAEVYSNPRSRSARLRAAERIK